MSIDDIIMPNGAPGMAPADNAAAEVHSIDSLNKYNHIEKSQLLSFLDNFNYDRENQRLIYTFDSNNKAEKEFYSSFFGTSWNEPSNFNNLVTVMRAVMEPGSSQHPANQEGRTKYFMRNELNSVLVRAIISAYPSYETIPAIHHQQAINQEAGYSDEGLSPTGELYLYNHYIQKEEGWDDALGSNPDLIKPGQQVILDNNTIIGEKMLNTYMQLKMMLAKDIPQKVQAGIDYEQIKDKYFGLKGLENHNMKGISHFGKPGIVIANETVADWKAHGTGTYFGDGASGVGLDVHVPLSKLWSASLGYTHPTSSSKAKGFENSSSKTYESGAFETITEKGEKSSEYSSAELGLYRALNPSLDVGAGVNLLMTDELQEQRESVMKKLDPQGRLRQFPDQLKDINSKSYNVQVGPRAVYDAGPVSLSAGINVGPNTKPNYKLGVGVMLGR